MTGRSAGRRSSASSRRIPSVIARIAAIPEVRVIDEVPEPSLDDANAAGTLQSGTPGTRSVWDQGLHGEGQVIGVLDGNTLDMAHCFFQDPGMAAPGPAHRKVMAVRNAAGRPVGAHHTFVAGLAAGDDFNNPGTTMGRGSAYNARLVSGTTADIASGSMLAELTAAAGAGATIHTNSWHDDDHGAGNPAPYNQTAVDVDTFTWDNEDHLVLGSAGNTGEEQGAPGTAKNAICCGAAQADPNEMNLGDGNPGPDPRWPAEARPGQPWLQPDLRRRRDRLRNDQLERRVRHELGHAAQPRAPRRSCASTSVRAGTRRARRSRIHCFRTLGSADQGHAAQRHARHDRRRGLPEQHRGLGAHPPGGRARFPGSPLSTRVWDYRNVDGLDHRPAARASMSTSRATRSA